MSEFNRRIAVWTTVVTVLALTASLSTRWPPNAGASNGRGVVLADEGKTCDQTTVAGTYGFQGQGTLGFGTPQAIPAAETGLATGDGAGNLSGKVTFSLGGQILSTPSVGTYQVNPDCTISEKSPLPRKRDTSRESSLDPDSKLISLIRIREQY